MKLYSLFVLLLSGCGLCSVVNRVRLVDHTSYVLDVITRLAHTVEERGWSSLRVPDYVEQLNETVLNIPVSGTVRYSNSFVASIQKLDILPTTVQQVWAHNATSQITSVSVRGSLRLLDVAIGYDVEANLNTGIHRYTAVHLHEILTFAFSIIKDVNQEDAIDVTVQVTVPTNNLVPVYRPVDNTSDVLASTFRSANINTAGINAWGSEVFRPIMLDIVTNQVPFPTFCYDCAA